jgi:hypothetical protein
MSSRSFSSCFALAALLSASAPAIADPPPTGEPASATTTASANPNRPFEIADNSFLVEEAFNQERGIFQNIFTATRGSSGGWDGSYTQEWPVGGMRHQFSYTVPFSTMSGQGGVGDVLINYRVQATEEHGHVPAISPRVSVILPNGPREARANKTAGWQLNLPVSKQFGNLYMHWNAGLTFVPGARDASRSGTSPNLLSPTIAASAIVRVKPMLNVLCEAVAARNEMLEDGRVRRERALTLSPGFRGGWNIGPRQVIVGAAVPVTLAGGTRDVGVLTYFSYELPFGSRPQ